MLFDLFNLTPFEICDYDMGFDSYVCVSRWVKNDCFILNDVKSFSTSYDFQSDSSDCKSFENISCFDNLVCHPQSTVSVISDVPLASNPDKFVISSDLMSQNIYAESNATNIDCVLTTVGHINEQTISDGPFDVLEPYGNELESQVPFVLAKTFGDPPMFIYYDYYIYLDLLIRLYLKFDSLMKDDAKLMKGVLVKNIIKAKLVNFQTFQELAHDRPNNYKD
jgi:hypothetical protein